MPSLRRRPRFDKRSNSRQPGSTINAVGSGRAGWRASKETSTFRFANKPEIPEAILAGE